MTLNSVRLSMSSPELLHRLAPFLNQRSDVLWLAVSVWLGWQWLQAAQFKLGDPAWESGQPLLGFWQYAVSTPADKHAPIAFDWYGGFIQALLDSQTWTLFAYVVACGEQPVGIALLFGVFIGTAAGFGALMNRNYMMAGGAAARLGTHGLVLAWLRQRLPTTGTPCRDQA
jgi:uncharacterized membrane protein YphA (DoxX/SURF4 family)